MVHVTLHMTLPDCDGVDTRHAPLARALLALCCVTRANCILPTNTKANAINRGSPLDLSRQADTGSRQQQGEDTRAGTRRRAPQTEGLHIDDAVIQNLALK